MRTPTATKLMSERPHAWRYRDYVIKSFNEDKPYDRFITEQIAGDDSPPGKTRAPLPIFGLPWACTAADQSTKWAAISMLKRSGKSS